MNTGRSVTLGYTVGLKPIYDTQTPVSRNCWRLPSVQTIDLVCEPVIGISAIFKKVDWPAGFRGSFSVAINIWNQRSGAN